MTPPDASDKPHELPFRKALPHLFLLTAIFFTTFVARIILAPLLPAIQMELGIDHRSAGHLFLILSAGYFASLLSTGYLASRFKHRALILSASVGLGLVLCGAVWIDTPGGLSGIAFMLGVAAGLYLPSGISAVTRLTHQRHWGRALAVHELAPNLAFIVAPVLAELALAHATWRRGLGLLGVSALLLGILYRSHGRGTDFYGPKPDGQGMRHLLGQPFLWLLMALFSLGIASTLGTYAMLPIYLVSIHGLDHGSANTLLAMSRLAALPMAFAGGWVADRYGSFAAIRWAFLMTGLATVALGLTNGHWLKATVFIQPVLAVCFFPAGFSALSALSPPAYRSVTVSLVIPTAFLIGGGAVPYAIGWLGDAGLFRQAFISIGVMITLGAGLTGLPPQRSR
jgi:NNP family nitrate/nitrite transporter-like MFS transporter